MKEQARWQIVLNDIINHYIETCSLTPDQIIDFMLKETGAIAESNKIPADEFKNYLKVLGEMYEEEIFFTKIERFRQDV